MMKATTRLLSSAGWVPFSGRKKPRYGLFIEAPRA
jgi:hypothetical protein